MKRKFKFWRPARKIEVFYFYEQETGRGFNPSEHKAIEQIIKCGGTVVAHFNFVNGRTRRVTSPIEWITSKRFKTSRNGNVFRYYDASKK